MEILSYLEEVAGEQRGRGPAPHFTEAHALLLLITIKDKKVGRKKLSKLLGLGEGSVRSMIRKFSKLGLIMADRGGCYLTSKGQKLLDELLNELVPPTPVKLNLVGEGYAVVIRRAPSPTNVIRVRDDVVRHGGEGALVLYMGSSGIIFPESGDMLKDYSLVDEEKLIRMFSLKEGDLLIVGFGRNEPRIISSILAAALNYMKESRGLRP